jgi:hypothetical protein
MVTVSLAAQQQWCPYKSGAELAMFYETVNTKEDDVDNNVERERKYSL